MRRLDACAISRNPPNHDLEGRAIVLALLSRASSSSPTCRLQELSTLAAKPASPFATIQTLER